MAAQAALAKTMAMTILISAILFPQGNFCAIDKGSKSGQMKTWVY
ncbi:hypothetical protein CAter282_2779 [Collimonas arenae]|uniref:Uncharacterized protein n=1 Tax=Collimonas arenae TaxID=279058 RepID=A0A127PS24_9BURK|nr:hypothetical protein CAter10_3063 [Collimonas arenae]AMP10505.1 hypothetical protein CAter282_2779 [Collimonas arenae]